jgi:hypothetical protein
MIDFKEYCDVKQLLLNGFGLGEVGDFHDPPRQICGALNLHFCQTRISQSYFS